MSRVTKAQLEKQLREAWEFNNGRAAIINGLQSSLLAARSDKCRVEDKLARLENLYTRVRVAIGGGTGQEPWDIFEKIAKIRDAGAFWEGRSQYWKGEWQRELGLHSKTLMEMINRPTRWSRLKTWVRDRKKVVRFWWTWHGVGGKIGRAAGITALLTLVYWLGWVGLVP